jgi:hypothetical protein
MKNILLALVATFITSQAMATHIVASFGKPVTDFNARTHILVVGNGSDLGTLFQAASAAKARKYADMYPDEQVLLISVKEKDKDGNTNQSRLTSWGYSNIEERGFGSFDSKELLSEMKKFSKIASVDVFSHSVAYYGVILDGTFNRMDPSDGYADLAGHFTSDAYAFLHGCNSGQLLAIVFSKQWGIPVAGSLTSTGFQKLFTNNQFYSDTEGLYPKTGSFNDVNRVSYSRNATCAEAACRRLMPDNVAYDGYWGRFDDGGLGFYKFYCETVSDETCFKTMAKAALSYVSVKNINASSSVEDFKTVLYDWLCPQDPTGVKRTNCSAALEKAIATGNDAYDPFEAKSLQCDFKGCKARFTCMKAPIIGLLREGSCKVINDRPSSKTTTLVQEYKAYLKGFDLLRGR